MTHLPTLSPQARAERLDALADLRCTRANLFNAAPPVDWTTDEDRGWNRILVKWDGGASAMSVPMPPGTELLLTRDAVVRFYGDLHVEGCIGVDVNSEPIWYDTLVVRAEREQAKLRQVEADNDQHWAEVEAEVHEAHNQLSDLLRQRVSRLAASSSNADWWRLYGGYEVSAMVAADAIHAHLDDGPDGEGWKQYGAPDPKQALVRFTQCGLGLQHERVPELEACTSESLRGYAYATAMALVALSDPAGHEAAKAWIYGGTAALTDVLGADEYGSTA